MNYWAPLWFYLGTPPQCLEFVKNWLRLSGKSRDRIQLGSFNRYFGWVKQFEFLRRNGSLHCHGFTIVVNPSTWMAWVSFRNHNPMSSSVVQPIGPPSALSYVLLCQLSPLSQSLRCHNLVFFQKCQTQPPSGHEEVARSLVSAGATYTQAGMALPQVQRSWNFRWELPAKRQPGHPGRCHDELFVAHRPMSP